MKRKGVSLKMQAKYNMPQPKCKKPIRSILVEQIFHSVCRKLLNSDKLSVMKAKMGLSELSHDGNVFV